jgi:hypothetical protein
VSEVHQAQAHGAPPSVRARHLGRLVAALVIVLAASVVVSEAPAVAEGTTTAPATFDQVAPGGQCAIYGGASSTQYDGVLYFSCELSTAAGVPVRLRMSVCDALGAVNGQADAPLACWTHYYNRSAALDVAATSTRDPDTITDVNADWNNNTNFGGAAYYAPTGWAETRAAVHTSADDVVSDHEGTRLFYRATTSAGVLLVRGGVQDWYEDTYEENHTTGRCASALGNGRDANVQFSGCVRDIGSNPGGKISDALTHANDAYSTQVMVIDSCADITCSNPQAVHVAHNQHAICSTGCLGSSGLRALSPKLPVGTQTCNIDAHQASNSTPQINVANGFTLRFACYLSTTATRLTFAYFPTAHTHYPYGVVVNVTPGGGTATLTATGFNTVTYSTTQVEREDAHGPLVYVTGYVNVVAPVVKTNCAGLSPTTWYPRLGVVGSQVCTGDTTVDYASHDGIAYQDENDAKGGNYEAVRIENVTATGALPAPPAITPGDVKAPTPVTSGNCNVTAIRIVDNVTGVAQAISKVHDVSQPAAQPFWNHAHSYTATVTFTGTAARLGLQLMDVLEDDSDSDRATQQTVISSPTSPATWVFTPLHDGYAFFIFNLLDSSSGFCDGGTVSNTPGDSFNGVNNQDYLGRIKACVGNAFSDGGGFSLFDPSTWFGSVVAALNPANYLAATYCIANVVIFPTRDASFWMDKLQTSSSTSASVTDAVKLPYSATQAFLSNADSGDCTGPTWTIRSINVEPIDSCTHSEMRDVTYTALTAGVYIGGALTIGALIAAAFGLKLPMPGAQGTEDE